MSKFYCWISIGNKFIFICRMVKKCHNLKFLDLSFCIEINDTFVDELRSKYPGVVFKKSFSDE